MPAPRYRLRGRFTDGPRTILAAAVLSCTAVLACTAVPAGAASAAGEPPSEFTLKDPRITESSGLAAAHAHPGVYWTHNDSAACEGGADCPGGPDLYAVDAKSGETVATVTMRGIEPRDVEAVSVGPEGDIYVADIGDNLGGTWPEVWIYRFPEPAKLGDSTVTPTRYTVRYADGARDAESMMVHPVTGRVYIASKNDKEKGGVYAGPEKLSASGVNTFERIAGTEMWATDGAFSPDGTRLVLRGYFSAEMYRWKSGRPEPVDDLVTVPMQQQGESVTFTPDGTTLLFGSEGETSPVKPVGLEGEQLPERAAKKAAEEAEEPGGEGDPGGEGGSPGAGDSPGDNRDLLVGGLTFALAVALWMGLRRLFRLRRSE